MRTVRPRRPAADAVRELKSGAQSDFRRFRANLEDQSPLGAGLARERPVNDSTFLFIGAVAGDDGRRPLEPGAVYWNSDKLELRHSSGAIVPASELVEGEDYQLMVTTSNGGDLDSHSAKVEAFLAPPRLGLVQDSAQFLGVQVVQVLALSDGTASFAFTATAAMLGQGSIFARTFSFLNNDLPASANGFSAALDRHVGQQSLLIVDIGDPDSSLEFDVALDASAGGQLSIVFRRNATALEALHRYQTLQSAGAAPANLFKAFPIHISSPDGSRRIINATLMGDRWQADFSLAPGTHHFDVRFAGIDVPAQHAAVFDVELTNGATSLGGLEMVLIRS